MITLARLLEGVSVTRNAFRHWAAIGALKTPQPETIRGRAGLYSRENALEVAFIGALVRAGITPLDASERAQHFMAALSVGALERFYSLNPLTSFGFGHDRIDGPETFKKIVHALYRQGDGGWVDYVDFVQIHIINLAHIVEVVDKLFEEEGA